MILRAAARFFILAYPRISDGTVAMFFSSADSFFGNLYNNAVIQKRASARF